jgi:hypothetical protein
MAHWLLAQVKYQNSIPNFQVEVGEIFALALKYYAMFFTESPHPAAHDEEYGQCLEEALQLCERLPPKEAVGTIESYLGVIPDRQGSYRYKCLIKMSDILEYHAKNSRVPSQLDLVDTERQSIYLGSNIAANDTAAEETTVIKTDEVLH